MSAKGFLLAMMEPLPDFEEEFLINTYVPYWRSCYNPK